MLSRTDLEKLNVYCFFGVANFYTHSSQDLTVLRTYTPCIGVTNWFYSSPSTQVKVHGVASYSKVHNISSIAKIHNI